MPPSSPPPLKPYVPYTLWQPGTPDLSLSLHCLPYSHSLRKRFIYDVEYDRRTAKRFIIWHACGTFILHGDHLLPMFETWQEISDMYAFDPSRHEPVEDACAPIIHRLEVKDFAIPEHNTPHLTLI